MKLTRLVLFLSVLSAASLSWAAEWYEMGQGMKEQSFSSDTYMKLAQDSVESADRKKQAAESETDSSAVGELLRGESIDRMVAEKHMESAIDSAAAEGSK